MEDHGLGPDDGTALFAECVQLAAALDDVRERTQAGFRSVSNLRASIPAPLPVIADCVSSYRLMQAVGEAATEEEALRLEAHAKAALTAFPCRYDEIGDDPLDPVEALGRLSLICREHGGDGTAAAVLAEAVAEGAVEAFAWREEEGDLVGHAQVAVVVMRVPGGRRAFAFNVFVVANVG